MNQTIFNQSNRDKMEPYESMMARPEDETIEGLAANIGDAAVSSQTQAASAQQQTQEEEKTMSLNSSVPQQTDTSEVMSLPNNSLDNNSNRLNTERNNQEAAGHRLIEESTIEMQNSSQMEESKIPVVNKGNQMTRLNLSQGVADPANSTDSSKVNTSASQKSSRFTDRNSSRSKGHPRYQELIPHPYQVEIYKKIKKNWANDKMGYGDVVYLETGTGKTYIAIMLLKYLFSDHFIDYQSRLRDNGYDPENVSSEVHLAPMDEKEFIDEDLKLRSYPVREIEGRREERHERVEKWIQPEEDEATLDNELKKQKKVVFITPTQNLVEQQASTIEAYTELCVGRYHGGQKQNNYYGNPKQWRMELAEQDVLIIIANKFYDLLMHGFMHMEEVDLLIFDECHHADQDHPYNLIMRDFWFHNFDPDNPLKVKRPRILGLTASPIKQKIERNKVQATEIEIMLQNLSNNLYARFVTMDEKEIEKLQGQLDIRIKPYKSNFELNLEAIQSIETSLLKKMAKLIDFSDQCYTMTEFQSQPHSGATSSTQHSDIINLTSTEQSILNIVGSEVHSQFTEEQDTQVLKFLNGRKQMISLNNDFTKERLSISSFKSYEDKVLVIFCIIIVKNINNLLLEIGPLAVKAFFTDLKRDLIEGMQASDRQRSQFGLKSEKAIEIIDQFCRGPALQSNINTSQSSMSAPDKSLGEDTSERHNIMLDSDEFQVSDKIRELIKILNNSWEKNNNIKTIIFVKDRSVAVYLKKLLAGDDSKLRRQDEAEASETGADGNGGSTRNSQQESREFISDGLLDRNKFKIGFAMGFKSKNIVNKAYKAFNTEKVSMIHDVLGQLPSVRAVKLTQNQLKDTLDRFRQGSLNILIATNVVEEGLDVSTCNQVICLNELLTVKAFIQMKGRARQENSKFLFVCAEEEKSTFDQNRNMFDRVINFMKKITTKTQRNQVVPEAHVLRLRRQQQEEFYEVSSTKAKVTAKQAKLLIEKFCTDFIEKSVPLDEKTKKILTAEDAAASEAAAAAAAQDNTSAKADKLSDLSGALDQTLNSDQIQKQIDDKNGDQESNLNQSMMSDPSANSQQPSQQNVSQMSQAQISTSSQSVVVPAVPNDNHLEFKPNYVVRECMKEGAKFFFCVLYFPKRCKEIILRKQNPEKACAKKRDAENHVALQAVKRLQMKTFLTEHLMTNFQNEKIKEHLPDPPPQSQNNFYKTKHFNKQNSFINPEDGSVRFKGKSNKSSLAQGMANNPAFQQPRRSKIITDDEKNEERMKHKRFEQHKKQVTFKAPPNQISSKVYQTPLSELLVYVFRGQDVESEYPYKDTNDFLGILFDREFTNPCMTFLMYQEQRAKQKNLEHLNNLCRKNLLSQDVKRNIEQKEECLSIAMARQDRFQIDFPMPANQYEREMSDQQRQQYMAAKLQCYHTWLFYYLYSADYKFIKAIFKLKFAFVKVLFERDFTVLFRTQAQHSENIQDRKQRALDMLEQLYFPSQQSQQFQQQQANNRERDESHQTRHNSHYNHVPRKPRHEKHAEYLTQFRQYLARMDQENPEPVPLQAYSVPVTNRSRRKAEQNRFVTNRGLEPQTGMRIDWATVERVIDWVRSRLYELCLPTERTVVLFKYTIDDPIRYFIPSKMRSNQQRILDQQNGPMDPAQQEQNFEVALHNGKQLKKDLAQMERAQLTGRLWDQKFQGNRFVILDQELIHDSQDKPIDLNQGKKDFMTERADYKTSSSHWYTEYRHKLAQLNSMRSSMSVYEDHKLNVGSKEFQPDESAMQSMSMNQSSLMMNTTIVQNLFQGMHPEHSRSFKTREFYFLKQGIFEHRTFSKYIVKCRKERHFLDFGKKKRDEELLIEQQNGVISQITQKRMMPHGINAKSFNQHTLKGNLMKILPMQPQAPKRTNTEFDILDQMLTLSPISYNQYQVLQTMCYHMLNFNELLMTEKFIDDVFGDLMCLLKVPSLESNHADLQPADASKDILHTFEQLMEKEQQENEIATVKGVLVKEQLLMKLDTVKEALTSPGACREYDYERLEFYGDSIIGFLVILELFVTEPKMVEGDLDFKRIQKVSNLRFFEVNKNNQFFNYMITETHQVYAGYDHAGFDDPRCDCNTIKQGKTFCTCKRSSCKITQKHQNELQNKLSQLKLIKKRLENFDSEADALEQIFMRGNVYQLAEMIVKDDALYKECQEAIKIGESLNMSSFEQSQDQSIIKDAGKNIKEEKIKNMCKLILWDIEGGPRFCLLRNIDKVIMKVESQINQNSKKNNDRSKRQKGPFYYKQLADVVESVTGAVTLACGLNCTQDYLRRIGVLDADQSILMTEMEKLLNNQKEKSKVLDKEFYDKRKFIEVEQILGYTFKCKAWLIEALTHKSFSREHEKQNGYLDDYERLEFLGDAVLGFLMARYFFLDTQIVKDGIRKNPKELHKMKTSVINNNLLSLIVIENKIHTYMIYNTKAPSFKEQFEKYVTTVDKMSQEYGTTKQLYDQKKRNAGQRRENEEEDQTFKEFDLDTLHEHNLKIFGDVFESIIGAVFLDSQSVEDTWNVLFRLIEPYVYIYADLANLQDHSRTLLLEMWNQKPYTKNLTCKHKTEELENGEKSCLKGIIVDNRAKSEVIVYSETFTKDAKSKVRTFYKHFYQLVKKFVDDVDLLEEHVQRSYQENPRNVTDEIWRRWQQDLKDEQEAAEKEAAEANNMSQAANGGEVPESPLLAADDSTPRAALNESYVGANASMMSGHDEESKVSAAAHLEPVAEEEVKIEAETEAAHVVVDQSIDSQQPSLANEQPSFEFGSDNQGI